MRIVVGERKTKWHDISLETIRRRIARDFPNPEDIETRLKEVQSGEIMETDFAEYRYVQENDSGSTNQEKSDGNT